LITHQSINQFDIEMMNDSSCPVDYAVSQCPFLQRVSAKEGPEFARGLALNPCILYDKQKAKPTDGAGPRRAYEPLFPEDDVESVNAVFGLMHGPRGCVPLSTQELSNSNEQGMPMMASMSLSGFSHLPHMAMNALKRFQQRQKQSRHNKNMKKNNGSCASSATDAVQSSRSSSSIGRFLTNPAGGVVALGTARNLRCPPAIVALRAAVARMKAVQQLRPHALPIRTLALAGAAISCNIPCGMLREHTKKFSPAWIMAVHATVPFVAMLRKAVLMPMWGLGVTVLGSIAGQQVGAILERKRMQGGYSLPHICVKREDLSWENVGKLRESMVLHLLPEGHPQAIVVSS
jgi:hypothetical protein